MSVLVVQVLPQGILFGADRNLTYGDFTPTLGQRAKVLKWQNGRAAVGYVGVATIGGRPADEWLFDFVGRSLTFPSLDSLAETLRAEVEEQRHKDERAGPG